jgi:hypothetical protein
MTYAPLPGQSENSAVFQLRTVANRKKPNLVRENLQSRNFMVPKPSALIRTPYLNADTRPLFFPSDIDHYPASYLGVVGCFCLLCYLFLLVVNHQLI